MPRTVGQFPIDGNADAVVGIDYSHHEIHDGSGYTGCVSVATGVQAAISAAFRIPAGAPELHMLTAWTSESKAHFEVYEDATWTTNTGAAVAIINDRRASSKESVVQEDKSATPTFGATMKILDTPTKTGGTLLLPADYTWADKKTGGKNRNTSEVMLKPDCNYLFLLTSDDGSKGLQICLNWYEHTDKGL